MDTRESTLVKSSSDSGSAAPIQPVTRKLPMDSAPSSPTAGRDTTTPEGAVSIMFHTPDGGTKYVDGQLMYRVGKDRTPLRPVVNIAPPFCHRVSHVEVALLSSTTNEPIPSALIDANNAPKTKAALKEVVNTLPRITSCSTRQQASQPLGEHRFQLLVFPTCRKMLCSHFSLGFTIHYSSEDSFREDSPAPLLTYQISTEPFVAVSGNLGEKRRRAMGSNSAAAAAAAPSASAVGSVDGGGPSPSTSAKTVGDSVPVSPNTAMNTSLAREGLGLEEAAGLPDAMEVSPIMSDMAAQLRVSLKHLESLPAASRSEFAPHMEKLTAAVTSFTSAISDYETRPNKRVKRGDSPVVLALADLASVAKGAQAAAALSTGELSGSSVSAPSTDNSVVGGEMPDHLSSSGADVISALDSILTSVGTAAKALMPSVAPSALPQTPAEKYDYSAALCFGANAYPLSSGLHPLTCAVNDAKAMAIALKYGHAFNDVEVVVDPTLAAMHAALEGLQKRLAALQATAQGIASTRVVIYFAGHGVKAANSKHSVGLLVPVDGRPDALYSTFKMSELLADAQNVIHATHTLVILDTCFSGLAAGASPPTSPPTGSPVSSPIRSPTTHRRRSHAALVVADPTSSAASDDSAASLSSGEESNNLTEETDGDLSSVDDAAAAALREAAKLVLPPRRRRRHRRPVLARRVPDDDTLLDELYATAQGTLIFGADSVAVLASTRSDDAFEVDGHGVFTKRLLEALSGGAFMDSGFIRASDIGRWVHGRMLEDGNMSVEDRLAPLFAPVYGNGLIGFAEPPADFTMTSALLEAMSDIRLVSPGQLTLSTPPTSPTSEKSAISAATRDRVWLGGSNTPRRTRSRAGSLSTPAGKHPETVVDIPVEETPWFFGRADVLESIRERFMAFPTAASRKRVCLYGLGGIGKTQTALRYAKEFQEHYQYVIFVSAESESVLKNAFVRIAQRLVPESLKGMPQGVPEDLDRLIGLAQGWFERHKDWLLIVDNADSPREAWLEGRDALLPKAAHGHILITSRHREFQTLLPDAKNNSIELTNLSVADSVRFLYDRSGISFPETLAWTFLPTASGTQTPAVVDSDGDDGLELPSDDSSDYTDDSSSGDNNSSAPDDDDDDDEDEDDENAGNAPGGIGSGARTSSVPVPGGSVKDIEGGVGGLALSSSPALLSYVSSSDEEETAACMTSAAAVVATSAVARASAAKIRKRREARRVQRAARVRELAGAAADHPPLGARGRVDAVRFLTPDAGGHERSIRQSEPDTLELQAAIRIACKLGGLPLALEQAGAYLANCGDFLQHEGPFNFFLNNYEKQKLLATEDPAFYKTAGAGDSPGRHFMTVYTTWKMSFDTLPPTSVELLNLCAFLDSETVPFKELLAVCRQARLPTVLENATVACVRPLLNASLVHLNEAGQTFKVHRLVQDVTRAGLPAVEYERLLFVAVELMKAMLDSPAAGRPSYDQATRSMAHVLALTRHARPEYTSSPPRGLWRVLRICGAQLRRYTDFEGALEALESAAEYMGEVERPSPDSSEDEAAEADDKIMLMNHLAAARRYMGDIPSAEATVRRALEVVRPNTAAHAATLYNMGLVLHNKGQFTEAAGHYYTSIKIYDDLKLVGEVKPRVAFGDMILFEADQIRAINPYMYEEKVALAGEHFERALSVASAGSADQTTDEASPTLVALALDSLSTVRRAQGKLDEALELGERALAMLQALPTIPSRPSDSTLLGGAPARHEQDMEKSLELELLPSTGLERALRKAFPEESERTPLEAALDGVASPDQARVIHNIASTLALMNEHSKAEEWARTAVYLRTRTFGPAHVETAHSLLLVGDIVGSRPGGERSFALDWYQRSHTVYRAALSSFASPGHPFLVRARARLQSL